MREHHPLSDQTRNWPAQSEPLSAINNDNMLRHGDKGRTPLSPSIGQLPSYLGATALSRGK